MLNGDGVAMTAEERDVLVKSAESLAFVEQLEVALSLGRRAVNLMSAEAAIMVVEYVELTLRPFNRPGQLWHERPEAQMLGFTAVA